VRRTLSNWLAISFAFLWVSGTLLYAQGTENAGDVRQERIVVSVPTVVAALLSTAAATWAFAHLLSSHVRRMDQLDGRLSMVLNRIEDSDAKREVMRAELLLLGERMERLVPRRPPPPISP